MAAIQRTPVRNSLFVRTPGGRTRKIDYQYDRYEMEEAPKISNHLLVYAVLYSVAISLLSVAYLTGFFPVAYAPLINCPTFKSQPLLMIEHQQDDICPLTGLGESMGTVENGLDGSLVDVERNSTVYDWVMNLGDLIDGQRLVTNAVIVIFGIILPLLAVLLSWKTWRAGLDYTARADENKPAPLTPSVVLRQFHNHMKRRADNSPQQGDGYETPPPMEERMERLRFSTVNYRGKRGNKKLKRLKPDTACRRLHQEIRDMMSPNTLAIADQITP